MLRAVFRFAKPSRRTAQLASKSFVGTARSFSVTSQSGYDIPKTQTAVMYEADNSPLQVREDWPVAQPEDLKAGEVLVRIAYTGVCHSDLSVWEGGGPPLPKQFPMIGGHEGAGYVAAIGANTKTKLKVGDAVGVKWLAHTCLGCEDCRKGYETTCGEAGVHGLTCHGTFQQWCVSFADHVTPIPKTLDLASAAPILCAGMTVYKALKQIGGSPVRACYMGYKVVAIDSGDDKPKLIESYGIKSIIDFKDRDVIDQVRAATGGRGAHAVIVVAGSKDAYKDPLMFLRPRGTLVAVGVPKDTAVVAPVEPLIPLEFRIVGSNVGSRQDAIEAIDLAADGHVKSSYTVEPLKNLPDVFKRMHAVKLRGRVVLDCE
ncbi:Zinc-binding dehydrogenase [Phytophthora infestans]|uniref:alcohol dehydrogenase n=1 Tax=Phytophthora infestans TaxID=4787 RepID=A0A8S9VHZ7_PHYIN|nr:Zinc-binding dehydrogenase [Phytophthora infestans]